MQTTEQKTKYFDPDKSLLSLPIVKKTIWTTLAISAPTFCLIAFSSNLELNFTYDGFNNFLKFFQFPIGILGLNIPLIALYGANHRSEQTKKQISINAEQNHFSNKFKHLEEFEKYNEKYNEFIFPDVKGNNVAQELCVAYIDAKNARKVYSIIYGESPSLTFEFSESLSKDIEQVIDQFIEHLELLCKSVPGDKAEIISNMKKFKANFFLNYSISTISTANKSDQSRKIINNTYFTVETLDLVKSIRDGIISILHLCNFDFRFRNTEKMKKMLFIDLSYVHENTEFSYTEVNSAINVYLMKFKGQFGYVPTA